MRFKMTPELQEKMLEHIKANQVEQEAKLVRGSDRGLLLRSISYLKDHGILDDEDIGYFPKKYPLTSQEFSDLSDHLLSLGEKKHAIVTNRKGLFATSTISFVSNGVRFVLHQMSGQGTATALMTADHNPKHIRFNEKKCIDLDESSTG